MLDGVEFNGECKDVIIGAEEGGKTGPGGV